MLTETTVSIDGMTINYAEGPPAGAPLVMLHGISTWWQTFLPILPSLMVRYHIYALDARGHGRSDRTPGDYYLRSYAGDVVSFLRSQVSEPAYLLGWSLGAMTSLIVAANAPELVRAIVLEDTPLNEMVSEPDEELTAGVRERFGNMRRIITMEGTTQDRLAELAELNPEFDEALARRRLAQFDLCDPETLSFVIERKASEGIVLEELLPQIACPVLLVKTDPDSTMMTGHAEFARSHLANAAVVAVPDAGHSIHTDEPVLFTRIVSDFLESCQAQTQTHALER